MATTTLTSLQISKPAPKDLCIICEAQPYDLICTCGDKFDFSCIHQHVEQLGLEFQDHYQHVSEKLVEINDFKEKQGHDTDASRTLINNWKRKRIQDINDIADKALNDIQQREDVFNDIASFQETYNELSTELHRIVHENLNKLVQLNQQIQDKIEDIQNLPAFIDDDTSLDAAIQSKLNPLLLNTNVSSSSSSSNINNQNPTTIGVESTISLGSLPTMELPTEIRDTEPPMELTNTPKTNDTTNESTNNDEFDAGQTRHIQRINRILIPANNDKFAAAICCYNNQLIYNDYDRITQSSYLVFLKDIANPTVKEIINWNQPETVINAEDDEWIQDIIYSDKLSCYLLLNRTRLRVYKEQTNELNEYHTFNDRLMKRLSSSNTFIYLTATHSNTPYNGDEIILMNYNKEEQLCKTFRDIIPNRMNRGAGPSVGEISDLAVGSNEQVIIGYRLERRHEVGVCLFNVTNDGKEWSCVKQLLLNECWHNNLSYTPRIDWSQKLNAFILIEYMTGHLIMIARDGQIEGECRFMEGENRCQAPINLTISTNDWLCVRYESSISIHKLTS